MPADHSAVDSTLGYAFQTLHALVVLLGAGDNESVTLELSDDVTLHHSRTTLDAPEETRMQLAHSIRARIPEVNLKSVKLWKTIGIWADEYSPAERYFLITCASVCDELQCLTGECDRHRLQQQLEEEATRVVQERQQGVHAHEERIGGCQAFLGLSPETRLDLLNRIRLCAEAPNIRDIDSVLDAELRNIGRPERRRALITRLREYWMNRACLSLTGRLRRDITKGELQQRIEELASTLNGTVLPEDYGSMRAPQEAEVPDVMRKQIELVNGGESRIARAKSVRWKSRNQRQKWLEDDIAVAARLNEFDQKLIDVWADRYGPMCHDTQPCPEEEKQRQGCSLLDWSHLEAPLWPVTIGKAPAPTYVTQGTYQDLADQLLVGWHPEYRKRLCSGGSECER